MPWVARSSATNARARRGIPWSNEPLTTSQVIDMKITAIDTYPVFNGARNNLYVTVDTDAGISGVGESGLSGRELAVIGAIEHFKPLLIGQDARRIEHIWQTLFRGGFFPANRVLASAPRGSALVGQFDLNKYVVAKTLDGLFLMLGEEEKKIRKDPAAQTTSLLREVFGGK